MKILLPLWTVLGPLNSSYCTVLGAASAQPLPLYAWGGGRADQPDQKLLPKLHKIPFKQCIFKKKKNIYWSS